MTDLPQSVFRDLLEPPGRWPSDIDVVELDEPFDLPTRESLVETLECGLFRWPYVQLLRDGEPVPPALYTGSRTVMTSRVQGFADPARIFDLMGSGAVLLLHSVQHWHRGFASALSSLIGEPNLGVRTYAAIGCPLRLSVAGPDDGSLGALIMRLVDGGSVRAEPVGGGVGPAHAVEADQIMLVPNHSARSHQIVSTGLGAVVVTELRRSSMADALEVLKSTTQDTADEALTTRFHQWDAEERRRRAALELLRTLESHDTEKWLASMRGTLRNTR